MLNINFGGCLVPDSSSFDAVLFSTLFSLSSSLRSFLLTSLVSVDSFEISLLLASELSFSSFSLSASFFSSFSRGIIQCVQKFVILPRPYFSQLYVDES